jgi:hypothetical protein
MPDDPKPSEKDMDEPVKIDLDREVAHSGLLHARPHPETTPEAETPRKGNEQDDQ